MVPFSHFASSQLHVVPHPGSGLTSLALDFKCYKNPNQPSSGRQLQTALAPQLHCFSSWLCWASSETPCVPWHPLVTASRLRLGVVPGSSTGPSIVSSTSSSVLENNPLAAPAGSHGEEEELRQYPEGLQMQNRSQMGRLTSWSYSILSPGERSLRSECEFCTLL